MPTDKHRIAAYIPKEIEERFEAFKAERGLGDSSALIAVLSEFFNLSQSVAYQGELLETPLAQRVSDLEERISKLKSELKSELLSELKSSELLSELKSIASVELPQDFSELPELKGELLPMNGRTLSKRFGLNPKVVTNNRNSWKNQPGRFTEWSKRKDPDGIGWEYLEDSKLFHPLDS